MSLRIHTRIVLPFLCLFVLSQALVTWFAIDALSREVERQFSDTLHNLTAMISRAGFPLNEASLSLIKAVIGYDVAVLGKGGMRGSSLDPESAEDFSNWLGRSRGTPRVGDFYLIQLRGKEFWVAYAELNNRDPSLASNVYLLCPVSRIQEAKAQATRPITVVVMGSIFGLAILGTIIARTIAAPIRELAEQSKTIGEAGLDERIHSYGSGEVGELADAFNRMLDSLKTSQERLVEAEKLSTLGSIAASVAHEIRNPLSSLRMTAQLLEKRAPDEERIREPLRVIREEIDRLDLALEEVLSFARPRQPESQSTDLVATLESILQLLGRQLEHAHIEVEFLKESLPIVLADEHQMKQVFVNLILNAMQAMPGGGKLTITFLQSDQNLQIRFTDTGSGIPEDRGDKVFEPFFTTREGGAGLGLPLSKRIIEQHGGSITFVDSEEGTAFTISLPVAGIS
jgi:signal transduction histidine kinase